MTPWAATVLVRTDDTYDRERASNNHSRYGSYLAQHPDHFHAWDEPDTPVGAEEFACAAWAIASGPIMAPAYVDVRDDLGAVRVELDQGTGDLVVRITVPLRHSALAARLPFRWRDWDAHRRLGGDDAYPTLVPPYTPAPVTVLSSVEVSVTATSWKLHTPMAIRGHALTEDAKIAVRLLAAQINEHAGPVIALLHGHINP
ncbi:hypothetical protein [Streptomyces hydrogenans]|uniref:hypothetical protein n=1 Tax=Streptomyces hydrogenans TaxID=1873719 RepID=UPI00380D2041